MIDISVGQYRYSAYLEAVITEVLQAIRHCRRCVVLTGAGISAESGVPTFRGDDGLWNKFRPEELATVDAFMANSKLVWEWYNWRRDVMDTVQPNAGHYALRDFAEYFENFTLITQNVDGLHTRAGSENVLELHGNINRNKCLDCNREYIESDEIKPDKIPSCTYCGGKIRPDVVWFGEMLDPQVIQKAISESEKADLFFSIGTSALVHPAASLPSGAKRTGAILIEVNPEITPLSHLADFRLQSTAGGVLPQIVRGLQESA